MTRAHDHRVDEAKAMSVTDVVDRLQITGLVTNAWELVGPCPKCGGDDRFSVHLKKKLFHCRKCDLSGGDMIGLVMGLEGIDFRAALDWLCGPRQEIDPAELARRKRLRDEQDRKQAIQAEKKRQAAIASAREIWSSGMPPTGTDVERYLEVRGLAGVLPGLSPCLRFHPALPYMVFEGKRWIEIDRRPAMLAALQSPNDKFCCVHRTWLDVTQQNGKAIIMRDGNPAVDAKGKPLKAKKTLGSTKGACIRLVTPGQQWNTLVMGEGIETTLTAFFADAAPGAAYWAGVDLGNMAGRMLKEPGKRHSGLPDMDDTRAFRPPPWVTRLIYIADGDSEPKMTRAKLDCGLKRAMAFNPMLKAQIVRAGAGVDLNDVLRRQSEKTEKEPT